MSALCGATVVGTCAPYVLEQQEALRTSLLPALMVMGVACAFVWQAHQAWNPVEPQGEAPRVGGLRTWQFVVVGVGLLALHVVLAIPTMKAQAPDLMPSSARLVWLGLPFIALFQVLLLLVLPYVIAFRVTGSRRATALIVVVVSMFGSWFAVREYDASLQLSLMALRLPRYIFLVFCYQRWRFVGAAVVSAIFWLAYLTALT
jgi:hypothetical protein